MIVRDQDGTIRYWSKEAELIYGWTPEESPRSAYAPPLQDTISCTTCGDRKQSAKRRDMARSVDSYETDGALVTVQSHWKIQHNPKNRSLTVIEINVESAA